VKRVNFSWMLVMTPTNDQASPQWNFTNGGRAFLGFFWARLGLTFISSQIFSVYFFRTSWAFSPPSR
jgi:hypothetical protein